MKNILIPIDFEFHAPQIIDMGLEIAKKFNSKIWLLHIASPEPDFVGYSVGPEYIRDKRAAVLKGERGLIQNFANMMKEEGVEATGFIFEGKSTIEGIFEEVEKLNIDFIIIGHHYQNWFQKIFNSGTDTTLVEKADVPVLTVPI